MPSLPPLADHPPAKLSEIASQEFDYVVVGAGTAGLLLAFRLVEDPGVTVAVIEAGPHNHNLDVVRRTRTSQSRKQFEVPGLMYPYATVPQSNLGGRSLAWARGRGVGGSSAVNFMLYQTPHAKDIDNWETLGSPGWNWERYHAAIMRAETFHPPSEKLAKELGYEYDPSSFGTLGPVQISYPKVQTVNEIKIKETFTNLGVPVAKDPAGGNTMGVNANAISVDPRTNTRSYAALQYYGEATHRFNPKLLTGATVLKVILRENSGVDSIVAEGVEFQYEDAVHTVRAKRDVILSAGTLRSSALLELSGIGNEAILSSLGIPVRVNNPAVGENVQEHLISSVNYLLDTEQHSFQNLNCLVDPKIAEEQEKLYWEGKGVLLAANNFTFWLSLSQIMEPTRFASILKEAEERVAKDLESLGDSRPGLREQYELQLEKLRSGQVPNVEIITAPYFFPTLTGKNYPGQPAMSMVCGLNNPFSRGSVHIQSNDPQEAARMDPNVFDHDIDLDLIVEAFKYCRQVAATAPFKDMIVGEACPGPEITSDEDIRKYIKDNVVSTWHTAGTCAMLPREKGGVVDASLKVYGTSNLRVCDLSIVPLHFAAHSQATAYAIGELLADIMQGEAK